MIYKCIFDRPGQQKKVKEGRLTDEQIITLNDQGYNIYYYPNTSSSYAGNGFLEGSQIDTFDFVFVDFDLKSKTYDSKDSFIQFLSEFPLVPTRVVDSGNGIHAYWQVEDLNAMTFLKLQRRLCAFFKTDPAVSKINQVMRVPGTYNTKDPANLKMCEVLFEQEAIYTSEQLSAELPMITREDEDYCERHYNQTFNPADAQEIVDVKMPLRWGKLLRSNEEVRQIWLCMTDDRSESDYRLAHIMYANNFTKDEALTVLANCQKVANRAPKHRISYAQNIVDKIWVEEEESALHMSASISTILKRKLDAHEDIQGTRFHCSKLFDNTACGFRLSHVLGLVGGSGVGKTAMGLNMFLSFAENNPEYDHLMVSLEQPVEEIAAHCKTIFGDNTRLYNKIHVMGNYDEDGTFRRLTFQDIKEYILKFQKTTGKKLGCVMIDHIGALAKNSKNGENEGLITICQEMKGFAKETNTFLIMQSQTNREKAGIGDLELNKDAAYGTMNFEAFCDYMVALWQPLKRCYAQPTCPTVTAFKFCKIRHKNKNKDTMQEDVRYLLYFDPDTERLRELTQAEELAFEKFNRIATNQRKQDRKTDMVIYTTLRINDEEEKGEASNEKLV
jgi:KaiC/GvpD/RAD55 family RecA-like ATPase